MTDDLNFVMKARREKLNLTGESVLAIGRVG